MKRLYLCLMLVLGFACNPTRHYVGGMYSDSFVQTDTFRVELIDSVCKSYGIPSADSLWIPSYYRDYETKRQITRNIFIQRMDSVERVYTKTNINDTLIQIKVKKSAL